ncbi:hypothetical protein GGU10DRAFT_390621 [Lentinula aff. detonsa]|uniref:DUF6532 domain-containing protein n=1 Tax=Lentinula aff. detonsa TaxID=2804958 RepID=A0AA38KX51_9AGAR|nr:hypothetical protein GGU10DRAFT_390621 [Lentinula aff. detonsa]
MISPIGQDFSDLPQINDLVNSELENLLGSPGPSELESKRLLSIARAQELVHLTENLLLERKLDLIRLLFFHYRQQQQALAKQDTLVFSNALNKDIKSDHPSSVLASPCSEPNMTELDLKFILAHLSPFQIPASSGVVTLKFPSLVLETLVLLLHMEIDASYSLSQLLSFSTPLKFQVLFFLILPLGAFSTISMAGGSHPGSGASNTPAANGEYKNQYFVSYADDFAARPQRSNRGQGGHAAQLEAVGNRLTNQNQRGKKVNRMPAISNEEINVMAAVAPIPRTRSKTTVNVQPTSSSRRTIPSPVAASSEWAQSLNAPSSSSMNNRYTNSMPQMNPNMNLINAMNIGYTNSAQLNPPNPSITHISNPFNMNTPNANLNHIGNSNSDWNSTNFSTVWQTNNQDLNWGTRAPTVHSNNNEAWDNQDRSMVDVELPQLFLSAAESQSCHALNLDNPGDLNNESDVVNDHMLRNRGFQAPTAAFLESINSEQMGDMPESNDFLANTGADNDEFNIDGDGDADTDADDDDDIEFTGCDPDTAFGVPGNNSARDRYLTTVPGSTNIVRTSKVSLGLPSRMLSRPSSRASSRPSSHVPSRPSSRAPSRPPSRAPSRPPSRTSKTNTLSSSSHASSGQAMQATQNTSSGSTPAPSTKTRRKTILATDDPNKDSFYPEQMKKLILRAKQLVYLHLVTENPFPRSTNPCFSNALDIAVTEFSGENIVVESGYLVEYRANILTLLYRDTSNIRSTMKKKARPVVQMMYKLTLTDEQMESGHNSRDKADIIIGKVEDLLSHENFLRDGFDELGKTNNIAHPGLRETVLSLFFKEQGSLTPVAQLFPESFSNSIPQVALALTMAVVRNCIEEYEMGIRRVNKALTTEACFPVYQCMLAAIDAVNKNAYHQRKLQQTTKEWARAGRRLLCPLPGNQLDVEIARRAQAAVSLD